MTASSEKTVGALGFIVLIVVLIVFGAYLAYTLGNPTNSETTSSSETTSAMSGVVVGYVTVGPSQPVCTQNQSCTVDITGYSLEFTPQCPVSSTTSTATCQSTTSLAKIGPNGHYSILLPAGTYLISGLSPSCQWVGCSTTFPKTVIVQGGMQISVDISIDTGIR